MRSESDQPAHRDRRWSGWAWTVLAASVILLALLVAAYVLRSTDDRTPSEAELAPCADGVEALASLILEDGVPRDGLGSIRTAAIATSRHCEKPGTPTYCRTAARAAWNLADAARTEARRAQALANFRRAQPRCLEELAALTDTASQLAAIQHSPQHVQVEPGHPSPWGLA